MTNEEIIEQLENAIDLIKQDGKDWLDDRDIPILEACIRSLTILGKIRAEIEQAADKQFQIAMGVADLNERCTHIQMENAYRHILNIFDKYRGGSEAQDGYTKAPTFDFKD